MALVAFEILTEAEVISCKSAIIVAATALSLGGCTAVISQASFYPRASLAAPDALLKVPDGYALAARAPVLLLSGTKDKVVRPERMREFQQMLEAGGTKVTFAAVPVGHGGALESAEGRAALSAFIARPDATQPKGGCRCQPRWP